MTRDAPPRLSAAIGDITRQDGVDAIVNAANSAMRGGGGVDGAIHRAGGPAILRECIERFPSGLATGDAGWTSAGDLPNRFVIHTVGPNHAAGQTDRALLESCYRRSLEVADELGVRSVAFPLISAGIYAWPKADAIAAAVETIASADTRVEDVRIVVTDEATLQQVQHELLLGTLRRILEGVAVVHERGYHRVRILPGMSPSGAAWRVEMAIGDIRPDAPAGVGYSSADGSAFMGAEVTPTTPAADVAEIILAALPLAVPSADDPAYVSWYAGLLAAVRETGDLPIAYAEYFDVSEGWRVGRTLRYPQPPALPGASL